MNVRNLCRHAAIYAAWTVLLSLTACERGGPPESPPLPPSAAETRAALAGTTQESQLSDEEQAAREQALSVPYAGHAQDSTDEDGVVKFDVKRSAPGLNLYTILWNSRAELIDEQGGVVRFWEAKPSMTWIHSRLHSNGDLLVVGSRQPKQPARSADDEERYVMRFDFAGRKLWEAPVNAHHDIVETPDGKLMAIAFHDRPIPALYAAGTVRDDDLVLMDQAGNVLESQSIYDILAKKPELFPFDPLRRAGGDVFHSNSLHWIQQPTLVGTHAIYEPGNLLISSRNQDRIFVINWPRKELVWAWGKGELDGQHDAQVLENGNILLFDNGIVRRQWSRVIELDPRSGKIVWEYHARDKKAFFSRSRGSAERLPNGNTLIANSDNGEAFEVTSGGDVVWRFLCPYRKAGSPKRERATIVRIKRHDKAWIEGLQKSAGSATSAPATATTQP